MFSIKQSAIAEEVQPGKLAQLLEQAEKAADDVALDPSLLDFLYKHRRFDVPSREAWVKEVRTAAALEAAMRAAGRDYWADLDGYLERGARHKALTTLKQPQGMLLITSHGGFTTLKRKFLTSCLVREGGCLALSRDVIEKDRRSVLFAALRALQGGGSAIMAPDGPFGKRTATLNVLGKQFPAGEGVAYLAATSGCATGWYNVVRAGDRFSPIIEIGPQFQKGEKFEAFKERLYAFMSKRIGAIVTGDPRNLILQPRWTRILRAG
jgi:hypothetical protein